MKYEIYQSGYSLTIQPQTFYHNCSVFSGTEDECKQRMELIRSLPHQLGETAGGNLITKIGIVGPLGLPDGEYIINYYGINPTSPILGSEPLFQSVI